MSTTIDTTTSTASPEPAPSALFFAIGAALVVGAFTVLPYSGSVLVARNLHIGGALSSVLVFLGALLMVFAVPPLTNNLSRLRLFFRARVEDESAGRRGTGMTVVAYAVAALMCGSMAYPAVLDGFTADNLPNLMLAYSAVIGGLFVALSAFGKLIGR